MEIVTNKEHVVYQSNKYGRYYTKKNDSVCWRCTIKRCNARLETDNGAVLKEIGQHNHAKKVAIPSAVSLRVACKRMTFPCVLLR